MLDRRLVVVTGKGGVGKSTVAAALAVAAADRGRRTIVAELSARRDVARLLGGRSGPVGEERPLGPRLHHIAIDSDHALAAYLHERMPRPLAAALRRSGVLAPLAAAAPGAGELLTVGQVWALAQRPRRRPHGRPYDLVILDAPATGHALALLAAPRTYAVAAAAGPVARQAAAIDALLRDRARTALVAVTEPAELAVGELATLRRGLRATLGRDADHVVVNALLPEPLPVGAAATIAAGDGGDPAVASALWLHRRAHDQRHQLRRLRTGLPDRPLLLLPFEFDGVEDRAGVQRVAARLGAGG